MQSLKFGIERFDKILNFGLWQIQVKDIQYGLHKTLREAGLADCSKKANSVSLTAMRDDYDDVL